MNRNPAGKRKVKNVKTVRNILSTSTRADEDKKEEYLEVLCKAMHIYIRTGVMQDQLEDFLSRQGEFNEKYRKLFDSVRDIDAAIEENINSAILSVRESKDRFSDDPGRSIQNRILHILMDVEYMSHVNMLYKLCEWEQDLNRKYKQYRNLAKTYPVLPEITGMLEKNKRMGLSELAQQLETDEDEINRILFWNSPMFNIRNRKNSVTVSLSYKGKKFNSYFAVYGRSIPYEVYCEQLYKNCNALMESLENSCKKGFVHKIKLEGMEPGDRRAIEHKYYRTAKNVIPYVYYTTMERRLQADEKVVYRIQEW